VHEPGDDGALGMHPLRIRCATTALLAWWVILIALAAMTVSSFQAHLSKGH
jgi:hypothetical protein